MVNILLVSNIIIKLYNLVLILNYNLDLILLVNKIYKLIKVFISSNNFKKFDFKITNFLNYKSFI